MTVGRRPLTIVEIDLDYCDLTYGSAPCTAALSAQAPHKCFNTYRTCQDRANYTKGTLTLRFAENIVGLPRGETVFPALTSITDSPAQINLSGVDGSTSPLGKRARVTVSLQDFPYHDTLTDKYATQRRSGAAQFDGIGYLPEDRSGFFAKLQARSPYYTGRALRIRRGQVGDAYSAMQTMHYVVSEWSGPDEAGNVQIVAKDILDLADNAKALCPTPNVGQLLADLEIGAGTLTLSPEGIGDLEYAASGKIAVGREVMAFTRSGDVVTLTERGTDGSTKAAHSAGDLVQQCYVVDNALPWEYARALLVDFAGVDPSFIDDAEWAALSNAWLGGMRFNAVIPRPTGVSDLLAEVAVHGVMIFQDPVAQNILFEPNRPLTLDEAAISISDEANLIEGTVKTSMNEKGRISTVQLYHGLIDATDEVSRGQNYSRVAPLIDTDAISENEYNQEAVLELRSRLLGPGDDATALTLIERLVSRYREVPRIIEGHLDQNDNRISLATVLQISTRLHVDAVGQKANEQFQVFEVQHRQGRTAYKAEAFSLQGRYGVMSDPAVEVVPDYSSATAAQRAKYFFQVEPIDGLYSDGTEPHITF